MFASMDAAIKDLIDRMAAAAKEAPRTKRRGTPTNPWANEPRHALQAPTPHRC